MWFSQSLISLIMKFRWGACASGSRIETWMNTRRRVSDLDSWLNGSCKHDASKTCMQSMNNLWTMYEQCMNNSWNSVSEIQFKSVQIGAVQCKTWAKPWQSTFHQACSGDCNAEACETARAFQAANEKMHKARAISGPETWAVGAFRGWGFMSRQNRSRSVKIYQDHLSSLKSSTLTNVWVVPPSACPRAVEPSQSRSFQKTCFSAEAMTINYTCRHEEVPRCKVCRCFWTVRHGIYIYT